MSRAPNTFTLELQVVIRRCREADLGDIEWFGAFSHHRQIFREAFELQSADRAVMLLAEAGGFPIGQAWLDLRAARPMVWAVRILPPFRGVGLGARLMAALEAEAESLGLSELALGVEKENSRARAFYERLGWRIERERQQSYDYVTPEGRTVEHLLDEWVMVKTLQSGIGRLTRA